MSSIDYYPTVQNIAEVLSRVAIEICTQYIDAINNNVDFEEISGPRVFVDGNGMELFITRTSNITYATVNPSQMIKTTVYRILYTFQSMNQHMLFEPQTLTLFKHYNDKYRILIRPIIKNN